MIQRILVLSEKNNISLKNLVGDDELITIQVVDRQTNLVLPNIPLVAIFNDSVTKCSTNNQGEC